MRALTFSLLVAAAAAFLVAPARLTAAALDFTAVLPPAPLAGSPRDEADRAIFRQTRALAGSPRWSLARGDANLSMSALLARLQLRRRRLARPRSRAGDGRLAASACAPDIAQAIGPAKARYRRKRPYLIDKGPICVPPSQALDSDFDYPSGHATVGWTAGLLLAMAAPGPRRGDPGAGAGLRREPDRLRRAQRQRGRGGALPGRRDRRAPRRRSGPRQGSRRRPRRTRASRNEARNERPALRG